MLKIRNVIMDDLPELERIENLCFSKEEAATKEAFNLRIQFIRDSFFVAEKACEIIGLVNGPVIEKPFITDDLFTKNQGNHPSGGQQSILGLAVLAKFQGQGVASILLSHFEREAKRKNRETITLTCREELIRLYENHGYENCGIANSQHGGVVWYNMIKKLKA